MEDAFSSPAGAALQREAGAPAPLTPLTELGRTYELERVQAFVLEHEARRVALQFPDELLGDSVAVARALEEMTGAKMFVLGDTAYGSCCVDVLGAEQAEADALVHFGPACLSPLSCPLPVIYVLGQRPVALELCAEAFRALHPNPAEPVVLLSEPACAHSLGSPFHVPVPPPDSELWDAPDVSLITGELRLPQALASPDVPDVLEASAVSQRSRLELAKSSPAALFLGSRTWQGLEPQLGQTAPKRAVAGRRGVPIAYEDEPGS
ncbi:2-(3-amino-3-carboxypropyl)histidine synthase subunit 2 isoform X3 [Notamacropus eugenii]|uniref:2-(3-amino-3-carboxypropyl)histidine synthase subunit 2 isoform X3 n=1 Tax=Notamacropus eugenii TaxID=9315 RepID=UPI003B672879